MARQEDKLIKVAKDFDILEACLKPNGRRPGRQEPQPRNQYPKPQQEPQPPQPRIQYPKPQQEPQPRNQYPKPQQEPQPRNQYPKLQQEPQPPQPRNQYPKPQQEPQPRNQYPKPQPNVYRTVTHAAPSKTVVMDSIDAAILCGGVVITEYPKKGFFRTIFGAQG